MVEDSEVAGELFWGELSDKEWADRSVNANADPLEDATEEEGVVVDDKGQAR